MKKKIFLNLESLRGIAAISVALYHFDNGSHFNNPFVENAWLMVDFFFVLSGFVVSLNYIHRLSTAQQLFAFQKKRFLRLYPLHFFLLIVFLVIEIAKYIVDIKLNLVANSPAFSDNNLSAFLANLLLVHSWTMSNATFNHPSWSISAEVFTYALFAILVYLTSWSRTLFLVIISISIFGLGWLIDSYGMEIYNTTGLLRCIYSFFIGVLTHQIYKSVRNRFSFKTSVPGILFIALSIFLVIKLGGEKSGFVVLVPFVFGFTILNLVLTTESTSINRLLSNGVLVYLGTVSYGIYMIHIAVWWIGKQFATLVLKLPTVADSYGRERLEIENVFLADLVSLLGIVVIISLAHLSYQRFEKRIADLASRNG